MIFIKEKDSVQVINELANYECRLAVADQWILLENSRKHLLPREPSKVIRHTYSKQAATLAMQEKKENIPTGYLQDRKGTKVNRIFKL